MKNQDVVWKVYPIEGVFDENTKLEFSIYGEVKSYSVSCPEGRIIKGSLQLGYPIVRFKRHMEMDEKSAALIDDLSNEIKASRDRIKILKSIINDKSTQSNESRKAERESNSLKILLAKQIKHLSKERAKINKKRAIYHHILIHKAVAELFLENTDPEKKYVIHENYDKLDNKIENLRWANKYEVIEHGFKSPKWIQHNLMLERSDKPRRQYSKLTYNDVVLIKRKLSKGEPMARLARRFGVSDMQIHRIKTGENWSDVKLSLIETEND